MFGTDLVTRHHLTREHYVSRYWCQRTLWESTWAGPSPIADADYTPARGTEHADLARRRVAGRCAARGVLSQCTKIVEFAGRVMPLAASVRVGAARDAMPQAASKQHHARFTYNLPSDRKLERSLWCLEIAASDLARVIAV